MEAINKRLKYLEDVETRLYRENETTMQKRAREDEQLQYKSQEEDRDLLEEPGKQDQEEDACNEKQKESRALSQIGVPSSNSGNRDYGPPTARDSQGRDLSTRPSDGKLVHLRYCVAGCGRSQFPNARALRDHVCSPSGLHKIKGLLMTNNQAIESELVNPLKASTASSPLILQSVRLPSRERLILRPLPRFCAFNGPIALLSIAPDLVSASKSDRELVSF
ncbi:hypothetical protein BDR22DRAFT_820443 [Usnea florida]